MTIADAAGGTRTVGTSVGDAYRSAFHNWERRASVRNKPMPVLADSAHEEAVYFPPELVPVISHPIVRSYPRETTRHILVQRLYHYLHFTSDLEQVAVIPVTTQISRGRSGLHLPARMRADAFRITTDEAWHAQFSYDLASQLERATAIAPFLPPEPRFIGRLDAVRRGMDAELRGLEELMFSIVSETLISSVLSDLPRDARLPAAVRDVVRDHAEDEGRHHAYFRELLTRFWPALDARERRGLGARVPELITAFLEPDHEALAGALFSAGLPAAEVEQVMLESFDQGRTAREIAAAAQPTVRYLAAAGAFDDGGTREAFLAAGLLAPAGG
jgi:hypothetical protein